VLIGMPTFLYHLLTQAVAENLALPNLKKIVLGGEKAPLGMRRKLRELAVQLGAGRIDVIRTYGFTEAKLAWAECPFHEDAGSSGYHIHPDLSLIEIVDPKTGEPRGEGESGEIVFTPLDARGSVVLRYRTGDCIDGGLFHEQCPYCGLRVPRLVGEISRSSEVRDLQLGKLKGTLVDFNHLEHVLDNAEHVASWQLELRKQHDDPLDLDELILHVAKSDDTEDAPLRAKLDAHFAGETEIHPNRIEFHTAGEMRRLHGFGTQLKEQRVVDNRPKTAPALNRS
jgi:phenylacetate-coenzyme A ligase PaaK-like adenylate-forming protein